MNFAKLHLIITLCPLLLVLEEQRPTTEESQLSKGSIKVASLMGNTELVYGDLDKGTKESILTELLVKSAITHAIKKQKVGDFNKFSPANAVNLIL